MVNRGDGGARRRGPPPARPAPRPPRPAPDDEDNEKTNAINLAEMDLDEFDAHGSAITTQRPAHPAPSKQRPQPSARRPPDNEDNEKTSALNLEDIDLDSIDAAPATHRPQPQRRGPPPSRAAAPPAARPSPARPSHSSRPRPSSAADEEKTSALSLDEVERVARSPSPRGGGGGGGGAGGGGEDIDQSIEKTSALNLDEIDLDAVDAAPGRRGPPSRANPAASRRPSSMSSPSPRSGPSSRDSEPPTVEKTVAVSLEDFERKAPPPSSRIRHEPPPSADSTFLVEEEEAPVVKAPPPKRMSRLQDSAQGRTTQESASEVEPRLVVVVGPDSGKSFTLTKDLTLVGRGLDADVVINDASASRKHFNVVRTLSGWKVVDLGSGNGTRVDGTRITEIAMKHGMRIEAGGTTLEWQQDASGGAAAKAVADAPPAVRGPTGMTPAMDEGAGPRPTRRGQDEKPQQRRRDPSRLDKFDDKEELLKAKAAEPSDEKLGDIEALEIDPDWEARRLKQRREGVGDVEVAEGEGRRRGGVGKKIAITGIVVAVLGGGFVAADKFAGLGIIFPKTVTTAPGGDGEDKDPATDDKPEPDKDPVAEDKPTDDKPTDDKPTDDGEKPDDKPANVDSDDPKEVAKAKVAEGDKALKEKRVLAARALYAEALEKHDLVDGGDSGLAAAENEIKAFRTLNESVKAIGEQKWTEALTGLQTIKEGSSQHALAKELGEIAEEGAVVEQLAKAAELFEKKDFEGAKAATKQAIEYAGEYTQGTVYLEAIERAAAPDADLTELDPSDPNAANPPKAQPSDLKPGLDAYAKGDFMGVVNALDAVIFGGTASRADVAKAKAWSAAATIFDEAMKQVAANVDEPEQQLDYLRAARRADAILGGLQKERLATELGKVYTALAKKAQDDKNVARAGLLAGVALKFDANVAGAQEIRDAAVTEARAWVAEAMKTEGDPDKAATQLARALRVLPTDDPDYAAADKKLGELLTVPE